MKTFTTRANLVLIGFFLGTITFGQISNYKSDIAIINGNLSKKPTDPYKRPYILKDEPSLIKKINPENIIFGGSLFLYQNTISKHISANCLYTPGCSEFSKEAIREYGILKGLLLSVDRVHRCDKFSATDLKASNADPVTKKYPDPVSKYKRVRKQNDY